jgi:hypothetical protein
MATYTQIQLFVAEKYGWIPETCWIADVKRKCGLPAKDAPNRKSNESVKPCPPEKRRAIEEAFRYFGMIE